MADRRRPRGPKGGNAPRTGHGPNRGQVQVRTGDEALIDPEQLVYGRHPVREAAKGRRNVIELHATESALVELEDVLPILRSSGCTITETHDHARLRALAGTGDHQGAVAQVEGFHYVTLDDLLAEAELRGVPPLVLCLDQVTDPHNLGAIARVADASGATGILIPEHRSASVTGAAVKASAGALEHVLVARCVNLANEIERVKGPNLWSYAATERGTADWTQVDLADGALIVLGAEGPGIRPRVEAACDVQVRIPMSGEVASLNVSTVSAILAFEAVRQRRAASAGS